MKSKLQQFFINLFFSLVVFVMVFSVCFVATEVVFRMCRGKELYLKETAGAFENQPYLFKPDSHFEMKSGKDDEFDATAHINGLGYRGKEMTREKSPGTLRIFAIGDSFTFGVGVEDNQTVPFLVEEKLKNLGINVEVVNAGKGHTSPVSYYLATRDIHLQYQPNVVMVLFDFNDLQDDWNFERHLVYDANGKPLRIDLTYMNGKKDWWTVLRMHSELLTYFYNKVYRTYEKIHTLGFKKYVEAKLHGKRAKAVISNMNVTQDQDTVEYDSFLMMRGADKKSLIDKHWVRTEKYLQMIFDLLKEHHIPMILVARPYGVQVGPDQWAKGRVYCGFEAGKTYDDPYCFQLLENFARKNNIPFVNTLNAFLKAKNEPLFYNLDGHLNVRGNQVMAEAIVENPDFQKTLLEFQKSS